MQKTRRVSPRWGLWLRGLDEWLVIFQKVSGLALALYLIGHVLAVSTALGFGHNVNAAAVECNNIRRTREAAYRRRVGGGPT